MAWFSSDPLAPGTPAPDFSLPDDEGRVVTLSALKGKNVVLVFYPGDDTPGCTRQLCEFRDQWGAARDMSFRAIFWRFARRAPTVLCFPITIRVPARPRFWWKAAPGGSFGSGRATRIWVKGEAV